MALVWQFFVMGLALVTTPAQVHTALQITVQNWQFPIQIVVAARLATPVQVTTA